MNAIPAWRLVAPYVVWMLLMAFLPREAWAYAVRTAVTLAALAVCMKGDFVKKGLTNFDKMKILISVIAGLAVCVIWIAPDNLEWYRRLFVFGEASGEAVSPYDPEVCAWPLTIARLLGSAFVISIAEELFFRKWLMRWLGGGAQAFFWMCALFAIEHDRWLAGAIAGAAYGILALRYGIASAIAAHATTNFALGVYVITRHAWAFW